MVFGPIFDNDMIQLFDQLMDCWNTIWVELVYFCRIDGNTYIP